MIAVIFAAALVVIGATMYLFLVKEEETLNSIERILFRSRVFRACIVLWRKAADRQLAWMPVAFLPLWWITEANPGALIAGSLALAFVLAISISVELVFWPLPFGYRAKTKEAVVARTQQTTKGSGQHRWSDPKKPSPDKEIHLVVVLDPRHSTPKA